MNIFEKMGAITSELSAVAKNLQVGFGRNSYKAVGEADVLAAVKPLENKYKVYSYPFSRKIVDSDTLTVTKSDERGSSETTKFFMRLETVYRFVDMEKPDSYIDITTYGDGVDSNDKAPGKAMTYGDKYALLKAYKIITGDDPDQNGSEDAKVTRRSENTRPVESPQNTTPPPQRKEPAKNPFICDDCGLEIVDYTDPATGEVTQAFAVVNQSLKTFRRKLCPSCYKKAREATA